MRRAAVEPEAFGQLYRLHREAISRYVYRRTGCPDMAEDVVAEVFLAALEGIGRFRFRGIPLRHWLYRIAGRTLRRWNRNVRRAALERLEAEPAVIESGGSDVAEPVHRALLRLPVAQQERADAVLPRGADPRGDRQGRRMPARGPRSRASRERVTRCARDAGVDG